MRISATELSIARNAIGDIERNRRPFSLYTPSRPAPKSSLHANPVLTDAYHLIFVAQGIYFQMVSFSRTLTSDQSQRVRDLVRTELQPRIPSKSQLAAALGVAPSNFSNFMDGTRGAPIGLALGVAFLLGWQIEDVLGIQRMPTFVDEQERRYPTRILAARVAYMEGVPLKRIHQVLSASLRYDGDPGVEWWVKLMRNNSLGAGSKEDTARAIERVGLAARKPTPRPRVKGQLRK